ncbi:uncharacterized protein LOC111895483 [Lactuca sativa]|uniref:uncharacterized protein LOC111895483 n=1 Tax=Lactuca sativa TaxID=4236 RepID=UPI000CD8E9AD|nr:uncharacterized protein LOC111895483 [Lactuca sativa]
MFDRRRRPSYLTPATATTYRLSTDFHLIYMAFSSCNHRRQTIRNFRKRSVPPCNTLIFQCLNRTDGSGHHPRFPYCITNHPPSCVIPSIESDRVSVTVLVWELSEWGINGGRGRCASCVRRNDKMKNAAFMSCGLLPLSLGIKVD